MRPDLDDESFAEVPVFELPNPAFQVSSGETVTTTCISKAMLDAARAVNEHHADRLAAWRAAAAPSDT